jgi:hypothetical protein
MIRAPVARSAPTPRAPTLAIAHLDIPRTVKVAAKVSTRTKP